MKRVRRWLLFLAVCAGILCRPVTVMAADTQMEEILDELDFDAVSGQTTDMPPALDFKQLVKTLAEKGTDGLDGAEICTFVSNLFFYEIAAAKPVFLQIAALGLLFALFGKVMIARQEYVSQIGFFVAYIGIILLLLQSFSLISDVVQAGVDRMVSFMTAFVPMYATTLLISGNALSAGAFYELAFGVIYLLELGMKFLFLPGIHVCVLLLLMDNLFEETKLSKMAQLVEDGIRLLLKGGLAVVLGINVVQSLIAPAKDRLSANGVYHSLSAVPGVGNTFGSAAEILLGCGILIKNSVGTAALILLVVVSFTPLCKVFCFSVMYRFTAALLAPVGDSRIAQCVQAAAKGCTLFLTLQLDALLLFFITIAMISASTSFIY